MVSSEKMADVKRILNGIYKKLSTSIPTEKEFKEVVMALKIIRNEIRGEKLEGRINVENMLRDYLCFASENACENYEKIIRLIRHGNFGWMEEWSKFFLEISRKLSELADFKEVDPFLIDDIRLIRSKVSKFEKEVVQKSEEICQATLKDVESALLEEIKDLKSALYTCEKLMMMILRGDKEIDRHQFLKEFLGNILASERHVIEVFVALYEAIKK